MQNFIFQNPVKIIFGKGQIAKLAEELPVGAKVLLQQRVLLVIQ